MPDTNEKLMTMDELKGLFGEQLKELIPALKNEIVNELKQAAPAEKQADTAEEKAEKSVQFVKDVVEGKAVSSGTSSFGYTIPTELSNEILEKRDKIAKMRKLAFTFKLAGPFQLPTEGTGVTTYWVGENEEITASDPTVGKKNLADYYLATRVLMPRQLLNTSAFNVVSYISNLCSRAIVATEETAFTAGDGSNKPTGLRQASITGIAQAGTDFAYDDLVNLYYGVPEQYRDNGVFKTSTAGIKLLRKLKDENGLPIFDVRDRTIFGRPVFESADIPSNLGTGTNETEIYFFDPFYYWIKDGEEMFMDTDKIISKLQTEIVVGEAIDGVLVATDAARKLTGVK